MIRTRRNPPICPQRNPSLQNPSSIIDHQVMQGLIMGILLVVDRHHQLEKIKCCEQQKRHAWGGNQQRNLMPP
ncbi:hypothetical protein PRUPE_4G229100 [Prunus persica]|uniref:Uncharacterized protein n=1 Tax=Prunus persica TaxID=3760 RepID=A0A251PPQ5_PRUPE|nr:hypothetical protein PRUPE_4G229100 [Prunus persica]